MAVPQIDALLLVPSSVAGGALGKVANKAGSNTSPPPPTTASMKPASSEASETRIHSIGPTQGCSQCNHTSHIQTPHHFGSSTRNIT